MPYDIESETTVKLLLYLPMLSSFFIPVTPVVTFRMILADRLAVTSSIQMIHLHDKVLMGITE